MAEFKPTAAQKAAIEARGSAVLVSAGAGSGKTKVLTERLMSYITAPVNPHDLDSFIIITFTKAAAAELRGRIMDELAARLASDPGNRRLRRQSALCPRAHIGTIHSFCASVLRENCHLLNMSPDFKIVDEERAQSMKEAALERVLEQHYARPEDYPGFKELADTAGAGRDDSRLAGIVLSLHEKMQCHARPEKWAEAQVELLSTPAKDVAETPWGQEVLSSARDNAAYWAEELERVIREMSAVDKISEAYSPSFCEAADGLRELSRSLTIGWDRARDCLPVKFPALGRVRNSPDPALSEMAKDRWNACKKAMARLEGVLASPSEKLLSEMAETAPAMKALLALTMSFDEAYSRDKKRNGLVDYSDLEHMAAKLLTNEDDSPTELARSISQSCTEVMVDEYQDVSRVQDSIFRAVSDEGKKLFLVGDVKQSIYRFRLADPEIFTSKYLSYRDAAAAAPGEAKRVILQDNFRSRREIIDCINSVFSLCMSRKLGDIDYDENAALKSGASYEGSVPAPELLLLELSKTEDGEEPPDKTVLEARLVGREILNLMSSGVEVDGRPLEYGDIAILMRSANAVGPVYRRELAAMGIPMATGQGGGFFTSLEVSGLMSLLAVIDNPHQDIPLIAVLRSPAFGFSADELTEIRSADRDSDFYGALRAAGEKNEKCRSFLALLEELRDISPEFSASELLWQLINRLDLLAVCSALPDGAQRRANLMELLELSGRFDSTAYRGLHRFVLWLRQLSEKGQEPGGGAASDSAVQIMTVHKSKGLEFPVVFLCDTARRFNRQDIKDCVLVHPELGLGSKLTDLKKHIEYPTLARNAIRLRIEREMLSEEMRLLYVALTRARERLIITAAVKKPGELIEKSAFGGTKPLSPEILSGASAPVNWLVSAALADGEEHLKIRVCQSETEEEELPAEIDTAGADEETRAELERRLSFVYPHRDAEELPSKITATELKGRDEEDEDALNIAPKRERRFRLPDFARASKPLSGAERGIATHLALQYLDFEKTGSIEEVRSEIERLKTLSFLSERDAEAVDAGAIFKLFSSELGERMRNADKLLREFKFSLLCDAGEIYGRGAGEELLLQGVVDCCMIEKGKLCIIDYKTDRVRNRAELRERVELYTGQIRAYAAALSRIFKMEVSESLLYFLSIGEIAEISSKDLQ
ncbi:MAG: helicase-exonuclease AddAB subunit AddA [Candidatus Limivicinus sp.]|jgi:ATP-dependent helicase/nuclease subunit A